MASTKIFVFTVLTTLTLISICEGAPSASEEAYHKEAERLRPLDLRCEVHGFSFSSEACGLHCNSLSLKWGYCNEKNKCICRYKKPPTNEELYGETSKEAPQVMDEDDSKNTSEDKPKAAPRCV